MKLPFKKQPFVLNNLSWKIAGEAGFGIAVSGVIFSKACTRGGLFIHAYSEYPSLIRGGHNTFQLTIRSQPVSAAYKGVNLLVALNKESIEKHLVELTDGALVLYDSDEPDIAPIAQNKKGIHFCPMPLAQLAKEAGADRLMRNTVAIGASIALLQYDLHILEDIFRDTFGKKGAEITNLNIKAAQAGYDYVMQKVHITEFHYRLEKILDSPKKQLVLAGNEAIGMGAIKAGVKFYAGYPMTPSSSLLHFMAAHQLEYNIVVKQTEDEISAANMAIGASFAGVRSMTATSGGGFSLMVESLGLAAITETPMVYVVAQRPGPATGLPTWTEQADLQFVLHAAQDEFPRIVVAPGDVDECFYVTLQSCNLAEKYQLPVIILSDKHLSESPRSTFVFDDASFTLERGKLVQHYDGGTQDPYKRYDFRVQDGVSPRTIPGVPNGIFLANSDEHDMFGFSNEEADIRCAMQEKRMKKFLAASEELPEPVLYGPKKADYTIVAWGSTKGTILEAMSLLKEIGISVNFLHILYISPFPSKMVADTLGACKNSILVENNMTGQLGSVITEHTGYEIENRILKYDGRPFFPEELFQRIKSLKTQKGLKKWLQ